MKKIFLLFLCAATCFANFAAEAFLRVDVDGTAGKNTLTPTAGETMSISRSWQNAKENLKYTLRARTVEKLSDEWKTVQFSFTPQVTGSADSGRRRKKSAPGYWSTGSNRTAP